jgi:hypothetical protein
MVYIPARVWYEGQNESNVSNFFFSENVTAIRMKFKWMIHTSFAVMRLFPYKTSVIFDTLIPKLTTTMHTSLVKCPALTLEHITKTWFQFTVICKMAST